MLGWSSPRGRVFVLLAALAALTVAAGLVWIWYTYQIESLVEESMGNEMGAAPQVEGLLQPLIKNEGFVSYYLMDGDVQWLKRMEQEQDAFRQRLEAASPFASEAEDREILEKIKEKYEQYIRLKDQVIGLYGAGRREEGQILHKQMRTSFDEILALCEHYEERQIQRVRMIQRVTHGRAGRMRVVAAVAVLMAAVLCLMLSLVLLRQVFGPIRRILEESERFGGTGPSGDEMRALRHEVRGLIEAADQTHQELEKSRTRMIQTEKMATVGRLAAGVAHSIRNPLTSIKMRLFSLERSLDLAPNEKEDLEVISEETRHIDTIVRNFLEYARPSKLRMQRISPSEVIDMNLELLRHRFKSYGVHVDLKRVGRLPVVLADPDQMKEVFVNLLINACEATGEGGSITIEEEEGFQQPLGPVAIIRISDNGPGIPAELRDKVFEPFFSTKEEGTGLGLSIAVRVIRQHGGWMTIESEPGQGTTFIITLPCREDKSWTQT